MKVDRKKIRVSPTTEYADEVVRLEKAEALSFIWDLTEEIYSLSGKFDVKSRLQRDVVSITRQ
jgi:hypothetical protein